MKGFIFTSRMTEVSAFFTRWDRPEGCVIVVLLYKTVAQARGIEVHLPDRVAVTATHLYTHVNTVPIHMSDHEPAITSVLFSAINACRSFCFEPLIRIFFIPQPFMR